MSQEDGGATYDPDERHAGADGSRDTSTEREPLAELPFDPRRALPVVVVVSAIAAALSGQEPTETLIVDPVMTGALGGVIPWLASRAGGRSVLGSAVLVLFFSGLQLPAILLAAGALLGGLLPAWRPLPAATAMLARAVSGALSVNAALNLPNIRWVGTASLMAVFALAPIAMSWWKRAGSAERSMGKKVGLAIVGVGLLASGLLAMAALSVRTTVETAVDDAEQGIDALQAADQPRAVALLSSATESFSTAEDRLGGPLAWPARLVPVVAQHSRALEVAAAQGRNLTATAVTTVTTADVDQIRGRNGAIDLELVREVDVELANANRSLRGARTAIRSVRSPWLVPFLDDQLADVETELVEVLDDVDLAKTATAVVPGLLGADAPRTYLVLFIQPAEAREYGGFVGAYGLLRADDGRLLLLESGSVDSVEWSGDAEFENPGEYPQHYFEQLPHLFPQNLTSIADLSTIARAAAELVPQWRNDPALQIDGVMTIDPYGLAGLLELTGPIAVESRDEPLDSSSVANFLLREQYLAIDDTTTVDDRRDGLRDLAGLAFAELLSIEIPGPERLGAIFGPLARENRIAFTTFDDAEQDFLRRILLDADMPIVGDGVSMLGVFQSSAVAGKLDAYGARHIEYTVEIDPVALTTNGTVEVRLENEVPDTAPDYVRGLGGLDLVDDPWTVGANHAVLSLYTRDEITTPTSNGILNISDPRSTLSYNNQVVSVQVRPDATRTVSWDTTGVAAPGRYDLLLAAQPYSTPVTFRVELRVPAGWSIRTPDGSTLGTTFELDGTLTHHRPIEVRIERDDS